MLALGPGERTIAQSTQEGAEGLICTVGGIFQGLRGTIAVIMQLRWLRLWWLIIADVLTLYRHKWTCEKFI